MTKTVVIIEDHLMVQQGFKRIIEFDNRYKVINCHGNYQEFESAITTDLPDAYLIDLSLPGKNGFDVVEKINKANLKSKILIISMYEQSFYINTALALNVNAYLSKRSIADDILNALDAAFDGKLYLSKQIKESLKKTTKIPEPFDCLTKRELELAYLFAKGYIPKKVALLTNIATKTVFVHRSNIYKKLNTYNQFDLQKLAIKSNLISTDLDFVELSDRV